MAQFIVFIACIVVIASTIILCIYKAAKDIQSKDRRKSFFFGCYLVSVGVIAFGFIWGLSLGTPRIGVYGYMFMALFIFLHGFGLTFCTTCALIAIKIVGLKT